MEICFHKRRVSFLVVKTVKYQRGISQLSRYHASFMVNLCWVVGHVANSGAAGGGVMNYE